MAVILGPTANMATIGQHRAAILAELATEAECVVDCQGLADLDLTFIQLLASASKLAMREGKSITLLHPPAAMAALMDRAGFTDPDAWSLRTPCTDGAAVQ